eukprot:gene5516-11114_t
MASKESSKRIQEDKDKVDIGFTNKPITSGEIDTEDDQDVLNRFYCFQNAFGLYYTSKPNFTQNYIYQVEQRMSVSVVGGSWASLGPTYTNYPYLDSGRVRKIIPHPTTPATVYVLASGGGLWKTTNFLDTNPTWIPLTDQLTTTSGGSMALGITNPDTIYLGLGDPFAFIGIGGLFVKSQNGGNTWSAPVDLGNFYYYSSPSVVYEIMVDSSSTGSDIILISTDSGIFRSVDGGITFTNVYDGGVEYAEIYSMVETSAGWIAYDVANKVYIQSTTRGSTWVVYSASNWNTITGMNAGRTTFAVGVAGDAIVYALVNDIRSATQLGVFRSTNGGVTWISLNCDYNHSPTTPIPGLQTDLDILGNQGWYNQMLLVDPSDSTRNTVYIGGTAVAAKTANGGVSWSIISTWVSPEQYKAAYGIQYVHADFHAAAYITTSTGSDTLIFGTDGGLFTSTDGGASWSSEVNRGLVTQLPQYISGSPLLSNRFMIGLQDLGTRERTSTSTVWQAIGDGDGEGCGFSQAVNKIRMITTYDNNYLCSYYSGSSFGSFSSCNTGIDYNDGSTFLTNVATPSATADATGNIFFTFTSNKVYRSSISSGKLIWNTIGRTGLSGISITAFRPTFHAIGIGPTTTSQIVVAKESELAITINGGSLWRTVNIASSISGWRMTASPVWASSTVLYVASEDTSVGKVRVAKSTNGGTSWVAARTGLPDVPVGKLLVSNLDPSGNTVYAGTWIGVYITTNGGVNWNVLGSGLPNVLITDIYQSPLSVEVATYGRGVWSLEQLSGEPSASPTLRPTRMPSVIPTTKPTRNPTVKPSRSPSSNPSMKPSKSPTSTPTRKPSIEPTFRPTRSPSIPTYTPTRKPSLEPTSRSPSLNPTMKPTKSPTYNPTRKPSMEPTFRPTRSPSIPTYTPTRKPSLNPTLKPSRLPSVNPNLKPTKSPTYNPTRKPSMEPTVKLVQ